MTTEQWERENQDTLMEYFIDGDPSVRRIQCEYCRKVIYTQTRNRKLILSILVDTFISKISLTMQPGPKIDSISGA